MEAKQRANHHTSRIETKGSIFRWSVDRASHGSEPAPSAMVSRRQCLDEIRETQH